MTVCEPLLACSDADFMWIDGEPYPWRQFMNQTPEDALDEFRAQTRCEWCGRTVITKGKI